MKTFKDLSLEQRTQIGQYYKDGLKAPAIASLYGTTDKTVNNVIYYMRRSGMIIPLKIKQRAKKVVTPELLVLPVDPSQPKKLQRWSNSQKREAYRLYRTTGKIQSVVEAFNITERLAYYLMSHGKKLSGVKGKTRAPRPSTVTVVEDTSKEGTTGDNVGFFILGAVVTVIIYSLI